MNLKVAQKLIKTSSPRIFQPSHSLLSWSPLPFVIAFVLGNGEFAKFHANSTAFPRMHSECGGPGCK